LAVLRAVVILLPAAALIGASAYVLAGMLYLGKKGDALERPHRQAGLRTVDCSDWVPDGPFSGPLLRVKTVGTTMGFIGPAGEQGGGCPNGGAAGPGRGNRPGQGRRAAPGAGRATVIQRQSDATEFRAALRALKTAGVAVRIEPLWFGCRIAAHCYVLPSGEQLGIRYLADAGCPDLWNLNERVVREAVEERRVLPALPGSADRGKRREWGRLDR
jgi:hypothetical protein